MTDMPRHIFSANLTEPRKTVEISPHCNWQGRPEDAPRNGKGKTIEELTAEHVAWYATNDDEVWHCGPFDTKGEAEAAARTEELHLIGEAGKGPIRVSKCFDARDFIEQAEESLADLANEDGDPLLDFTAEVVADLQKRVRQAMDEWQVAHQISPQPWMFSWCKDEPSQWSIEDAAREEEGGAA